MTKGWVVGGAAVRGDDGRLRPPCSVSHAPMGLHSARRSSRRSLGGWIDGGHGQRTGSVPFGYSLGADENTLQPCPGEQSI